MSGTAQIDLFPDMIISGSPDALLAGRVIAVSVSPKHGFSKQAQPLIRLLAGEGIEGDAHRGTTIQHLYLKRRNPLQPNHSQVHLLASEVLSELAGKGFTLQPGDLGENVLTEGLDLLALPTGTRLALGPEAVVVLTGLRTPCSKIDKLSPGLQQHLWGERIANGKRSRRAGVMSTVERGGDLRPGDPISVYLPPTPYLPLQPV